MSLCCSHIGVFNLSSGAFCVALFCSHIGVFNLSSGAFCVSLCCSRWRVQSFKWHILRVTAHCAIATSACSIFHVARFACHCAAPCCSMLFPHLVAICQIVRNMGACSYERSTGLFGGQCASPYVVYIWLLTVNGWSRTGSLNLAHAWCRLRMLTH